MISLSLIVSSYRLLILIRCWLIVDARDRIKRQADHDGGVNGADGSGSNHNPTINQENPSSYHRHILMKKL